MSAQTAPLIPPHRVYKSISYQCWILFQRFFRAVHDFFVTAPFLLALYLGENHFKRTFFLLPGRDGLPGSEIQMLENPQHATWSDKNKALGLGVTSSSPKSPGSASICANSNSTNSLNSGMSYAAIWSLLARAPSRPSSTRKSVRKVRTSKRAAFGSSRLDQSGPGFHRGQ